MKSLLPNSRRADVVFYRGGKITLSSHVVRILGISPGDVIDVLHDGADYFLYVSHYAENVQGLRYRARCYSAKRGTSNLRANSARLCSTILSITHCQDFAALPVGNLITDPLGRKLLTLLTCIPQSR